MGITYYHGIGVSTNLVTAFQYHLKAAEQGDPDSQYQVGWMYENGEGTAEENEELAERWYFKAAEQDHAGGQFALSTLYDEKEDKKTSFEWCLKAATQGHISAMYNTGYNYKRGYGVEKNINVAFEYYSKAAKKGDADAQYIIGRENYVGKQDLALVKNRTVGLKWLRRSAEQDFEEAQEFLANLKDEREPDFLTYYHVALCYRHRWALDDDVDATNEKTFLKRASVAGYRKATLELAQLYERYARKLFAEANARMNLSFSYASLIDLLMLTTNLPFDLSVLCLSFLENEAQFVSSQCIRQSRRKRKRE